MRVLGLDPGYGTLGYGILDHDSGLSTLVKYGAITTSLPTRFPKRLSIIGEQLEAIIKEFNPEEIAIEELFFHKNIKTAMLVSQARGVILYVCENQNIPLYEYTPLQVKQALTGYGRADKRQIQEMVKLILKLDEIPKPDDAADALALAIVHAQTNKQLGDFRI